MDGEHTQLSRFASPFKRRKRPVSVTCWLNGIEIWRGVLAPGERSDNVTIESFRPTKTTIKVRVTDA